MKKQEEELMAMNPVKKSMLLLLKGKVVGVISGVSGLDSDFLKLLEKSLKEWNLCADQRKIDHERLMAGEFDDKIKAWEEKHPDLRQ